MNFTNLTSHEVQILEEVCRNPGANKRDIWLATCTQSGRSTLVGWSRTSNIISMLLSRRFLREISASNPRLPGLELTDVGRIYMEVRT